MVWYAIGNCAKDAYIYGNKATIVDSLTALQFNFLMRSLDDNPNLIKLVFEVSYMTIKDAVTSHRGSEHNPGDARSVEEVSHLMQTHTLYLNH